jgi:hypothetical protein
LEGCIQFERQNWALAQGKLIACREIMAVKLNIVRMLQKRVILLLKKCAGRKSIKSNKPLNSATLKSARAKNYPSLK